MIRRTLFFSLLALLIAACDQATATPSVLETPRVAAKQLATVFMSPTPNDVEREATRRASSPTPTRMPPTSAPTATAYVGVFLGAVENQGEDFDVINPDVFANLPTPENIPTPGPVCEIAPEAEYGELWSENDLVRRVMGCPIQISFGFNGNIQIFENGVMYWREETGEIWAIEPSGFDRGRYWHVEEPPSLTTDEFTAPEGLRVPIRGFGGVWKGVSGVREALGFAQTGEERVALGMQRFDGGTILFDRTAGQLFALAVNGDAYGPF